MHILKSQRSLRYHLQCLWQGRGYVPPILIKKPKYMKVKVLQRKKSTLLGVTKKKKSYNNADKTL